MSGFGTGNHPIVSTQLGTVSNPTTQTLIAEIDFNSTLGYVDARSTEVKHPYQVTWILGNPTTAVIFLLDHALSTGTGSTALISQTAVPMSSGQSAQFQTYHSIGQTDRLRVRIQTSVTTALAGKIIALPLF